MHKCVTFIHKGRCPTHSRQRGFRGPPAGATGKLFDFAQHLLGCGPRYCVICGARMEVAALDEAATARDKWVHSRQKRPQIGGRVPNVTKSLTVPLALNAMAERQGSYQTGSRVRVGAVPPPVSVLMRTASAGSCFRLHEPAPLCPISSLRLRD